MYFHIYVLRGQVYAQPLPKPIFDILRVALVQMCVGCKCMQCSLIFIHTCMHYKNMKCLFMILYSMINLTMGYGSWVQRQIWHICKQDKTVDFRTDGFSALIVRAAFSIQGSIISCDLAFAHLHGYGLADELTGLSIMELMPSLHVPLHCRPMPKVRSHQCHLISLLKVQSVIGI